MLQRSFPWVVGGLSFGLVVSMALWFMFSLYVRPFTSTSRSGVDPVLVSSIIETGINNPEVQTIIKNQVVLYLKSSEGRARMAETFKSPELVKALAENLQTPELRAAVVEMMKVPEFRRAVLDIVKDTPEMKLLTTISSAIIIEDPGKAPVSEPHY